MSDLRKALEKMAANSLEIDVRDVELLSIDLHLKVVNEDEAFIDSDGNPETILMSIEADDLWTDVIDL